MPEYRYSELGYDSSYESDGGTTYRAENTGYYKFARYDLSKKKSKRSIQLRTHSEGLTYFLYHQDKAQQGNIDYEQLTSNVLALKQLMDAEGELKALTQHL